MRDIRDFGAKGDGLALDSPAIQAACDAAARSGGGTVVVPPGRWRCGTIILRSRVHLQIQVGARVIASTDLTDYILQAPIPGTLNRDRYHLIIIDDACDVTIDGGGCIEGCGPEFWDPEKDKGGEPQWRSCRGKRVAPLIEVRDSMGVRIEQLAIVQSPGWTLHCLRCQHIWLRGLQIRNHPFAPEADGVVINGCHTVIISDCMMSTSGDAVAIRASQDAANCESIAISNCILQSHCSALKIGSQNWFDIRHITITNCIVRQSSRALGIYGRDGGRIEQITVTGLSCDTECPFILNRPIQVDLRQRNDTSRRSRLHMLTITNFSAVTDGRILLTTADDCQASRLTLDHITLRYPHIDDPLVNGQSPASQENAMHNDEARVARAAIVADGIDHLAISGLHIQWPDTKPLASWAGDSMRLEHGANNLYPPLLSESSPPFAAFWARGLIGGRVDLGGIQSSHGRAARADIADSSGTVLIIDEGSMDSDSDID
ncbi:MAG: hypothetical protein EA402_11135 [Planctomycetota bacterium]|nr:MAG: hypothetical protein EA402_11135 [Planctomycetota bacterium]